VIDGYEFVSKQLLKKNKVQVYSYKLVEGLNLDKRIEKIIFGSKVKMGWTSNKLLNQIKQACLNIWVGRGDSQNFFRFFVTLGLKILRLFRLRVLFEADIIKGVMLTTV